MNGLHPQYLVKWKKYSFLKWPPSERICSRPCTYIELKVPTSARSFASFKGLFFTGVPLHCKPVPDLNSHLTPAGRMRLCWVKYAPPEVHLYFLFHCLSKLMAPGEAYLAQLSCFPLSWAYSVFERWLMCIGSLVYTSINILLRKPIYTEMTNKRESQPSAFKHLWNLFDF